jgi:hypothetical protein
MRRLFALISMLLFVACAHAQITLGIHTRNVSIGVNLPLYPELVRVPGYPVYYAPDLSANYFFYDGMYWVYEDDYWYASSWYNGPWDQIDPEYVPLFLLRVPVRYYRLQPVYFRSWRADAPPHWGEHWGNDWTQHRRGWDQWDRNAAPAPAPLPSYQRQFSGDRYPRPEQQKELHNQNYRYRPRETVTSQPSQRATPIQRNDRGANMPKPNPAAAPQQRETQRHEIQQHEIQQHDTNQRELNQRRNEQRNTERAAPQRQRSDNVPQPSPAPTPRPSPSEPRRSQVQPERQHDAPTQRPAESQRAQPPKEKEREHEKDRGDDRR